MTSSFDWIYGSWFLNIVFVFSQTYVLRQNKTNLSSIESALIPAIATTTKWLKIIHSWCFNVNFYIVVLYLTLSYNLYFIRTLFFIVSHNQNSTFSRSLFNVFCSTAAPWTTCNLDLNSFEDGGRNWEPYCKKKPQESKKPLEVEHCSCSICIQQSVWSLFFI